MNQPLSPPAPHNTGRKTIAVLGGSFNPPHEGHFELGCYLHQTLGVDEIWMMLSENPFKDSSVYASIDHRMAMGQLMAAHYPDVPFVMSDVETRCGTHQTYHVLNQLRAENPDQHFIWVMGADSLVHFHKWEAAEQFMAEYPIVVLDRPGYKVAALAAPAAQGHLQSLTANPQDLLHNASGWCFLDSNPQLDLSSSALLNDLRAGQRDFGNRPFQDVVDYIHANGLYGLTTSDAPAARPPAPSV